MSSKKRSSIAKTLQIV